MGPKLKKIADAMDKTTGDGRDDPLARQLADQYVADNPAQFTQMQNMSVHDLIKAVEVFRDAGMAEDEQKVETFLLHKFEPLSVGGAFQAKVRIPLEGK